MAKPNWDEIRKEWETTKITLTALAKKYNVKLGTLKSRKSREKWSRDASGKKDATIQKDATLKKRMDATEKESSDSEQQESKTSSNATEKKKRKQQSNRSGNPNPKNQFTKRNSAALKHGFYSKHIPQETLDIMTEMEQDPSALLWSQIMLQYAAIMRAQQIMFVEDKYETIKELKKLKVESGFDREGNSVQVPIEKEYEFQFAWDRQASFLNAQSRAMGEFRSLIKQFNEMAHEDDYRRLQLEKMQVTIDKTNAETENLTGTGESNAVDEWVSAMGEIDE